MWTVWGIESESSSGIYDAKHMSAVGRTKKLFFFFIWNNSPCICLAPSGLATDYSRSLISTASSVPRCTLYPTKLLEFKGVLQQRLFPGISFLTSAEGTFFSLKLFWEEFIATSPNFFSIKRSNVGLSRRNSPETIYMANSCFAVTKFTDFCALLGFKSHMALVPQIWEDSWIP